MISCGGKQDYQCTPTGHEEGAPGYEYECSDGLDNDCDKSPNCRDDSCKQTDYCEDECDKDQDGFTAASCGGDDCEDENPIIPLKDPMTQARLPESGPRFCENRDDDDCDGLRDDEDPDCNPPPSSPTPIPTPTPTPTPCPCNDCFNFCPGGEESYPKNYSYYCYSSYMVTTSWISYDNGESWQYLSETWEYIGTTCSVTQY